MELSQKFYENHAKSFSDTRFCLWDVLRDFGEQFKKDDVILDAGCGNGKNIKYFQDKCNLYGFDKSQNLVSICQEKGYNVCIGDILDIPFNENNFDYIMCIAVVHHLDSQEKHIQAIEQLLKCLKKEGKCLITLWAFESDEYSKKKKFKKGENIVKFKDALRYYYIYDEIMLVDLLNKIDYKCEYYWERGNWNIIFTK